MTERSIKARLAEYAEQQAEWCRQRAAESSDPRSARSARGLLDVADYVREIEDEDPRLLRIEAVDLAPLGETGDTLRVGDGAQSLARAFRYDDPLDDPDALLTRFAAKMEADGSSLYADGRSLADIVSDLDSDDPMMALMSIRFVGEQAAGWEERAVGLARDAGWSWDRIATVLGRTRQSVWSKHRDGAGTTVIGGAMATTTRAARKVRAVLGAVPQPGFRHGHDVALTSPSTAAADGVQDTPEVAPAT